MNMAIDRIIRDIHWAKNSENTTKVKKEGKSPKVKSLKEKTTETIKTIQKNNSTDNFMKFQWSWTL
tara:strand:+ start:220 stop:417 length:198 start_codon:yes stop_codon:yes gene_type:complete